MCSACDRLSPHILLPRLTSSFARSLARPFSSMCRFFQRKAEDLHRRLQLYKSSLSSIQSQLSTSSSSSSLTSSSSSSSSVQSILPTLRSQHSATLQLAARLSSLEAGTGELKDEYRALWRERTGSVRDPFEERRREVLGYSGDGEKALEAMAGGMAIR